MPKENKKPVILWVSDSHFMPTGYGYQSDLMTAFLAQNGFEIHYLGHQSTGLTMIDQHGRTLYAGMGSDFSKNKFNRVAREVKPDLVIALSDWWSTAYIGQRERGNDWAYMQIFPIDGVPFDNSLKWSEGFASADFIFMLSRFGKDQLEKAIEYIKHKNAKTILPKLDYIYHGVDIDIMCPKSAEVNAATRKEYKIHPDAKVYTIVARNQPRKNYPMLFKAWADFVQRNDLDETKAVLWVHALKKDAGWDLGFLKYQIFENPSPHREGLDKDKFYKTIKFTPDLNSYDDLISPEDLAKLYSMSDYFVLPTVGEGFGVPIVESMACGVPPILTHCTTSPELLGLDPMPLLEEDDLPQDLVFAPNGILVPATTIYTHKGNVDRFYISRKKLVEALEYAYNNPDHMKELGENGRKWVLEHCDMQKIVEKLEDIIMNFWDYWKGRPVSLTERFGDSFEDKKYIDSLRRNAISPFTNIELTYMQHLLPEGTTSIFDVGVGVGGALKYFNQEGFYAIGCDISHAAIRYCKERGLSVRQGNMLSLTDTFEGESYDVVMSSHVIEHIQNWKKGIDEMWDLADKAIVLMIPYDNMRDISHVRPFFDKEVKQLIDYVAEKPDYKDYEYRRVYSSSAKQISYVVVMYKDA